MSEYKKSKYTAEATQIHARDNSLCAPWCAVIENYYLATYGKEVKLIEAQLKEKDLKS